MNPNITKSTLSLALHSFSTMTTEPSTCCRLSYSSYLLRFFSEVLVMFFACYSASFCWNNFFLNMTSFELIRFCTLFVCLICDQIFFEEKKNVIEWKLVLWFIQNKCIDYLLLRLWEDILIIKRFAGCCACRKLSTLKNIVRSCTSKRCLVVKDSFFDFIFFVVWKCRIALRKSTNEDQHIY